MTTKSRVRCVWSGWEGAPGVSTFVSMPVSPKTDELQTFFWGLRQWLPSVVRVQVPMLGDEFEAETGDLNGSWSSTEEDLVQGMEGNGFAAAAGFSIQWITAGIVDGHRVKGRTYIVPSARNVWDGDGSLSSEAMTSIRSTCTDLLANVAGELYVWSRPRGTTPGSVHPITGFILADKSVVLRSRRD